MDDTETDSSHTERTLQILLEHMPDLVFFKDRNSRFTCVNPAFAAFVGLSNPGDAIGKCDADFFPPVEAETFRTDDHTLFRTGKPQSEMPRAVVGADGRTRWLQTTKVPIHDATGHITGLVGIARDLTKRMPITNEVRAREVRHRELLAEASRQAQELALFDEVRTALARELDLQTLFQTVVEAIARTFGYTLVSLYMLQEDDLVLQHQVGYDRVEVRLPVNEGVSGRVVQTGKPILLEDVRTDPAFIGAIPGIVSEVCVPLYDAGRVVGTLNVESRDGIRLTDSDLHLMVALSEHVTVAISRARLYTEVRQSEARFGSLIRNALDLISILDADGTIRYESPAVERALGYQTDALLGRNAFELVHPDDLPATYAEFVAAINDPARTPTVEFRFRHCDGSWRWLEATGTNLLADPAVGGFVVNSRDVTERKEHAARLWHQAHHDPLTGLLNRPGFIQRLDEALDHAGGAGESVAVLFMDLDRFKVVNDSLGHFSGDQVLVAVGTRLRALLRESDVLARFGGDEFAILLTSAVSTGTAEAVAQCMLEAFKTPFTINGGAFFMTASIGIALGSPTLSDTMLLMQAADVAMYIAKEYGPGGYAVFDPAMNDQAVERLELETDLQWAMERKELVLHYQPKIDLRSGATVAVEALLRWQHPSRGLLHPGDFLPLAEETGLMLPLGRWVLEEACRQAIAWRLAGITDCMLSVNLSAWEFRQPDLVAQVTQVLTETELPPGALELEITEQVIVDNDAALSTLEQITNLGVHLALDDFGTGYSALTSLRRLPIETLKIDHSFVQGLLTDSKTRTVVRGVTTLAHDLGMQVIAEGVETQAQLEAMRDLGIDIVQGFYFAQALPAADCMMLLTSATQEAGAFPTES
jgi:diguanylate cyclase (GGDEF)-like protein/PAS domain S-box-containing protein